MFLNEPFYFYLINLQKIITKISTFPVIEIVFFTTISLRYSNLDHFKTSQKNKLFGWMSTVLICFGGSLLSNWVTGNSLMLPFRKYKQTFIVFFIWYIFNFPFFSVLQNILNKTPLRMTLEGISSLYLFININHGVAYGQKHFNNQIFIITIIAFLKGYGHELMLSFFSSMINFYNKQEQPQNTQQQQQSSSFNPFLSPSYLFKLTLMTSFLLSITLTTTPVLLSPLFKTQYLYFFIFIFYIGSSFMYHFDNNYNNFSFIEKIIDLLFFNQYSLPVSVTPTSANHPTYSSNHENSETSST